MIVDLPPKLWVPEKPAIIRPAMPAVLKHATFPFPFMMPATLAVEYVDSGDSAVGANPYSFIGKNFGAPAPNRYIFVVFNGLRSGAYTLSSATIGGVTAAIALQNAATNIPSGIITAAVPTGTSGDISLTFSSSLLQCSIDVFRVVNLQSVTPVGSIVDTYGVTPNWIASNNLATPSGGFILAGCQHGIQRDSAVAWKLNTTTSASYSISAQETAAGNDATWSGVDELSDRIVRSPGTLDYCGLVAGSFR